MQIWVQLSDPQTVTNSKDPTLTASQLSFSSLIMPFLRQSLYLKCSGIFGILLRLELHEFRRNKDRVSSVSQVMEGADKERDQYGEI